MSEPYEYVIVSEKDPGAIGAGSVWSDVSTDPPTLKQRNSANSGWSVVGGGGGGGGEIGYDEITSDVAVTSTDEANGTVVIACSPHTFDGEPVIAEFFASLIETPNFTGVSFVNICLFEDSTELGRLMTVYEAIASNVFSVGIGKLRFTPTAGAHTYTVTAFGNASGGVVFARAGGTGTNVPAYMRFTKAT